MTWQIYHESSAPVADIGGGIRVRTLRPGDADGSAWYTVHIPPGGELPGRDEHPLGPEGTYVLSGEVEQDGVCFGPGTLLHGLKGSSHIPRSEFGCTLLVVSDNYAH